MFWKRLAGNCWHQHEIFRQRFIWNMYIVPCGFSLLVETIRRGWLEENLGLPPLVPSFKLLTVGSWDRRSWCGMCRPYNHQHETYELYFSTEVARALLVWPFRQDKAGSFSCCLPPQNSRSFKARTSQGFFLPKGFSSVQLEQKFTKPESIVKKRPRDALVTEWPLPTAGLRLYGVGQYR